MPFTFAHAAAALPLRRLSLVFSAVVVGTLAPDFPYFLQLTPRGGFGHTFAGAFLCSLPLALLVLWAFHTLVKGPLVQLFPDALWLRMREKPFRWGGPLRFVWIAVSALAGIATHIVWDSFTHRYAWPTRHWPLLQEGIYIPMMGWFPLYKVLQHASSLVGMLVLCAWVVLWFRNTEPRKDDGESGMPASRRWLIAGAIMVAAVLAGIARTVAGIGGVGLAHHRERVLGDGVVTTIAVAWWLLVLYGIVTTVRQPSRSRVGV